MTSRQNKGVRSAGDRILIRSQSARCIRTLTFILSLTARGDRNARSGFRRSANGCFDRVENFFDALKDLGVPEPEDAVAFGIEKRGAEFVVARSLNVLGAIEFDDQASFGRAEIGEVGADGELAAEFGVAQPAGSEVASEDALGFGLVAAQAAGGLLGGDVHWGECSRSERGREERNLESRRALYADPHLHPLPGRERRQSLTGSGSGNGRS